MKINLLFERERTLKFTLRPMTLTSGIFLISYLLVSIRLLNFASAWQKKRNISRSKLIQPTSRRRRSSPKCQNVRLIPFCLIRHYWSLVGFHGSLEKFLHVQIEKKSLIKIYLLLFDVRFAMPKLQT